MANGITRLYKAIWYTQVGQALEQADRLMENPEVVSETYEDISSKEQGNNQHHEWNDRLMENPEAVRRLMENPEAVRRLMENPEAVRGAYEDIIRDKQGHIQRYKQAIGQLIALVEQKKGSLKGVTDDIDKLEQMKAGAINKKKDTANELQKTGISDEEIKQHPDYVRCVTSYNDFQSTLEEKNARVAKLEQDIERAQHDIESHKLQITRLHRDLDRIKTEQSEAVADIITARGQEDIDNMLSGISMDDASAELARIREIREKAMERSKVGKP